MINPSQGPWDCEYTAEDCFLVNKKTGGQLSQNRQENQANARLIAAAPEMLNMLIKLHSHGGFDNIAALSECQDLIARATGKEL